MTMLKAPQNFKETIMISKRKELQKLRKNLKSKYKNNLRLLVQYLRRLRRLV
jgi:hypothetical protein